MIFLLCLLFLGVFSQRQLKQVQVITRHGARTPFDDLPKSNVVWNCKLTELARPDFNELPNEHINRAYRKRYIDYRQSLPGNCSQGELTFAGYLGHKKLGEYFRFRYVDELAFLNETFDSTEFFIRSTDSPRTFASAQSQLLGFYPPSKRFSADVIDIFTIEPPRENLLPNMRCPKLGKMCYQIEQSNEWQQKQNSLNNLKKQLQTIWNTTNIPWWIGLYDAFYSRQYHQIPLPDGITEDMVQQITDLVVWQLNFLYGSPDVAMLGVGTFITELVQQMNNVVSEGQKNPKWIYYSAHDTTLALVMAGFNILKGTGWPPYVANLIFELWQDTDENEYQVHLLYNNQTIIIPGCDEFCDFEIFVKAASQFSITQDDWANECGTSKSTYGDRLLGLVGDDLISFFC